MKHRPPPPISKLPVMPFKTSRPFVPCYLPHVCTIQNASGTALLEGVPCMNVDVDGVPFAVFEPFARRADGAVFSVAHRPTGLTLYHSHYPPPLMEKDVRIWWERNRERVAPYLARLPVLNTTFQVGSFSLLTAGGLTGNNKTNNHKIMSKLLVTVSGDTLDELKQALLELMNELGGTATPAPAKGVKKKAKPAPVETDEDDEDDEPQAPAKKGKKKAKPAPVETDEDDEDEDEDEDEGDEVTLDTLRALGKKIVAVGKAAELKKLLKKFGADSISTLPEKKYAAVYAALPALLEDDGDDDDDDEI